MSNNKVLKLESFNSWRRAWLTCTNKKRRLHQQNQCETTSPKHQQKYRNPPPSILDCLALNQPCVLWIVVSLFSGKQTMVPEAWFRFLTSLLDTFHRDRSVYTQHSTESSMTKPSISERTHTHITITSPLISQHQQRGKEKGSAYKLEK